MQFENNSWTANNWLIEIIRKVARQAFSKLGNTTINLEDLQQDLYLAAATDTYFLASLRSCADETQAFKTTYGFLDKTRKKLCRRYRNEWPKIRQISISSPND